ncbi:MAG: two-component regulator propeller domain-containing protein [Bacteroidota bacterium]
MLLPYEGQAQKYFFSQFLTGQGLPADQVRAVVQDRVGFVWVATDNGLARFDGQQFASYRLSSESRYIKTLFVRENGQLLFANDVGVFGVEPHADTAYVHSILQAASQPSDSTVVYPNGLFEDHRGQLWISQPNATVARWRADTLASYPFSDDHATGRSDSGFFFAEDQQGTLWMAASTGQLYHFDRSADRFERARLPQAPGRVHDFKIRGDTLWVVGDGLTRALVNEAGQLDDIRFFPTEGRTLTDLAFAPSGLLLGTQREGLFLGELRASDLTLKQVFGANDPHRVDALPFLDIHDLFLDADGSIWVGSEQGLGLLQSRFFEGVVGLSSNNTIAIEPTTQGRVLVSIGDVYELQPSSGDYIAELEPATEGVFVNGLAVLGETLWKSTNEGRLLSFVGGRPRRVIDLSARGSGIFSLLGDRKGNLWFCQAPDVVPLRGVSKLRPDGQVEFYDDARGVESRILIVRESSRGVLYAAGIGPETYLFRYQEDQDRFINMSLPLPYAYSPNLEVHDLAIDARGIVWLATTDGLLRHDLERVQRVDLGAFTDTEIRSVEAMPDGSIWLATATQGLLYFRDGRSVQFDEDSGLPTQVSAYRALRSDDQHRIWVGTAEGTVYSRAPLPRPAQTPSPLLLSAQVNDQVPARLASVSMRTNDRLALRYTTLAFPGHHLQYQYRLTGSADSSWSTPVSPNALQLDQLPPGEYLVEVRAQKGGGAYWSAPLSLPVRVRPVWYRTPPATVLFLLSGLGVVLYLVRLNAGRLQRRIHQLEQSLVDRETALDESERELEQQRRAVQSQAQDLEGVAQALSSRQVEIENARLNLHVLHEFIQALPHQYTWRQVVQALAQTVDATGNIDAFEFGFYDQDELCFEGYEQARRTFTHRRAEFSEKTNLAVWCLVRHQPLLITDYAHEHEQYVEPSDQHAYASAMYVPFDVPGRQQLILVMYGLETHAFDDQDLMMAQLLADYLSVSAQTCLESDSPD